MPSLGSTWTRRAAALLCVGAALAGCSAAGAATTGPTPSAVATPAPDPTAAAAALDEVVWALRTRETGQFTESGSYSYPEGAKTRYGYETVSGSFDLTAGAWQSRRDWTSDASDGSYGEETRTVGPTSYARDRWVGADGKPQPWYAAVGAGRHTLAPMTATFGTTTIPTPLQLLTGLTVTDLRPAGDGAWTTIVGTVPAESAVWAAGADIPIRAAKVSTETLTGTATAELSVDAEGLPRSLVLRFAGVSTTSPKLNDAWRAALTTIEYRATFSWLGSAVDVEEPATWTYQPPPARSTGKEPEPTGMGA
ncbi:MAG: hypothetical protein ACT4QG_21655 [Sporichthyaceae bacterium]